MSCQEQNEQNETTMHIFTGPPAGGFATDAGKETCECEKNDKYFSHGDLGSKVDDPEFHDSATDGKKKPILIDEFSNPICCQSCNKFVVNRYATSVHGGSATDGKDKDLHVDNSGMPLYCLYCSRWVVDPRKHYTPPNDDDSQPNQIPCCQIESYTLNMCNRCSYPEVNGSDHTDASDRLCNRSCYAKDHVDHDGLPVMCGICENWIKNHENHSMIFDPPDVRVSPFCVPDDSEIKIQTCNNCEFPKIRGSVHHTDPTRPCDPSRYANGEITFLDKTGSQIQCVGCLKIIIDPREHKYVPYLDTHEWCWSCTQYPDQMMSFASGGF